MKPEQMHEGAVIAGNLPSEKKITMGIDMESTAHLMSIMTNMYSNRIAACVREYSTNGRDADIEAGYDGPLEVVLPTPLSGYFKVRDHGTGLGIEELTKYYAQYGASSKRDSNDFNGMLGIGCKAALTYSSTFTVSSVKAGKRYVVSITTNADGVGELNVISVTPAPGEPSGTEVSIPVKRDDMNNFTFEAQKMFRWWEPGTFRGVNVSRPKVVTQVTDKIATYARSEVREDLIVMGNVAYPIPYVEGLFGDEVNRDYSIVYFADMGEVTFAPSREALMTTTRTKKVIDEVRQIFRDNLVKSVQREMDSKPTFTAAMFYKKDIKATYDGIDWSTLRFRGYEIPSPGDNIFDARKSEIPVIDQSTGKQRLDPYSHKPMVQTVTEPLYFNSLHSTWGGRNGKAYSYDNVFQSYGSKHESHVNGLLIITGAPAGINSSPSSLSKVRQYHDHMKTGKQSALVITGDYVIPGKMWLDGATWVEWDAVKAKVAEINKAAPTFTDRTKYDVYSLKDGSTERRQVSDSEKVFFMTTAWIRESDGRGPRYFKDWAIHVGSKTPKVKALKDYTHIVVMPRNRWAKFEREHKHSMNLAKAMGLWAAAEYATIDTKAMQHAAIREDVMAHRTLNVNSDVIDDPALVEAIKVLDDTDTKMVNFTLREIQSLARWFGADTYEFKKAAGQIAIAPMTPASEKIARQHIGTFDYYTRRVSHTNHTAEVCNALYYYNKKGKK